MKNKNIFILTVLFIGILSGCKKSTNDVTPAGKLEGTWKIQSAVIKDSDGTETQFWTLYVALFPCAANITYTFSNGNYTTTVPSGCVDGDGQSLALLSGTGGTYTLVDDVVSVDIDGQTLPGKISFSGNTATVVTVDPTDITASLTIVFVKV